MLPTLPLLYRHQADREICKDVTINIILGDLARDLEQTSQPSITGRPTESKDTFIGFLNWIPFQKLRFPNNPSCNICGAAF